MNVGELIKSNVRKETSIRLRGFSIDNMEHEYGIKCIGMSVLNKKKQVVVGISISGPSLRFDEDKIKHFSSRLQEVIQLIESKI